LRGKILNVERAASTGCWPAAKSATLIQAMGTGIREEFNIEKLR